MVSRTYSTLRSEEIIKKHIRTYCRGDRPIIYLAGPMEACQDYGKGWRFDYTLALAEWSIDVINPSLLEAEQLRLAGVATLDEFKALKVGNPARYKAAMRHIIDLDLCAVENSDGIICRYNGEATAGTIHEVGYAFQLHIPCYLVTNLEEKDILGWFLACFDEHAKDLANLNLKL
jgi:nucleoside 2-deoxyribosyltransferase